MDYPQPCEKVKPTAKIDVVTFYARFHLKIFCLKKCLKGGARSLASRYRHGERGSESSARKRAEVSRCRYRCDADYVC